MDTSLQLYKDLNLSDDTELHQKLVHLKNTTRYLTKDCIEKKNKQASIPIVPFVIRTQTSKSQNSKLIEQLSMEMPSTPIVADNLDLENSIFIESQIKKSTKMKPMHALVQQASLNKMQMQQQKSKSRLSISSGGSSGKNFHPKGILKQNSKQKSSDESNNSSHNSSLSEFHVRQVRFSPISDTGDRLLLSIQNDYRLQSSGQL